MAEYHMLPSLKKESELLLTAGVNSSRNHNNTTATTTTTTTSTTDDCRYFEQHMIEHWDVWNDQAVQRTIDHQHRQKQQRDVTSSSSSSSITTTTNAAQVPSLDHMTYQDFQTYGVYEPSDDTFLFLDAIQYELSSITTPTTTVCVTATTSRDEQQQQQQQQQQDEEQPTIHHHNNNNNNNNQQTTMIMVQQQQQLQELSPICLEIGCGSGVVSVYFRTMWLQQQERQRPKILLSYVTDVNPMALQTTHRTFQQAMKYSNNVNSNLPDEEVDVSQQQSTNTTTCDRQPQYDNTKRCTGGQHVEYILCDIATPLVQQLRHKVSYILCNPPYVPTCDSEMYTPGCTDDDNNITGTRGDIISAAYAGGHNGRRMIDRMVPQMIQLLSIPDGVAYLVTVDENLPLQLALDIHRQQQQQQQQAVLNKYKQQSYHNYILQMKPLFRKRTKNEFLTIQKISYARKQPR